MDIETSREASRGPTRTTLTTPMESNAMDFTTPVTAQSPQQAPSSSPRPAYRRNPSSRQFIRSTRTSVRIKPRPGAPTVAIIGVASQPIIGNSAPSMPGSTSSPRRTYTISARKTSISSPRKVSGSLRVPMTENDLLTSSGGNMAFSPGAVRPTYSILYCHGRRNTRGTAAGLSTPVSSVPLSSSPAPEASASTIAPKESRSEGASQLYHPSLKSPAEPTASPTRKSTGALREYTSLPEEKTPLLNTTTPQKIRPSTTPSSPTHQPTVSKFTETQEKDLAAAQRELEHRKTQLKAHEAALKQFEQQLNARDEALTHREQQLQAREAAVKQGEQRLHQNRAAFEQERERRPHPPAEEEADPLPKPDKARRTTKVASDDSWWRRPDTETKPRPQQPQPAKDTSRHSSWSSVPPSDTDEPTTNTTWTSPNLSTSYATYTARWAALPPHSPHIPYPSPNHTAAALHDTTHLPPPAPSTTWSPDATVKHNTTRFFLAAHGVPAHTTTAAALDRVGDVDELKALVRAVRQELRRWHEDGLKHRSGGGGGVNEALVRDETARAVFRAFTELRDALLAEVRGRREREVEKGSGEWTMLSEAML